MDLRPRPWASFLRHLLEGKLYAAPQPWHPLAHINIQGTSEIQNASECACSHVHHLLHPGAGLHRFCDRLQCHHFALCYWTTHLLRHSHYLHATKKTPRSTFSLRSLQPGPLGHSRQCLLPHLPHFCHNLDAIPQFHTGYTVYHELRWPSSHHYPNRRLDGLETERAQAF
jgi:hypothetical protein